MVRYQLKRPDTGERSDPRAVGVPTPDELLESGESTKFSDMSGCLERVRNHGRVLLPERLTVLAWVRSALTKAHCSGGVHTGR